MKCKFCDYEWKERVTDPISCPRCKTRKDYEPRKGKVKLRG